MFLAILSRIRIRIFLGGSGDGNEWMNIFWVVLEMEMSGCMWMHTSGVEAACMSERASES